MLRSFNCCSIVAFKDDQAGAKTSAVAFWILMTFGGLCPLNPGEGERGRCCMLVLRGDREEGCAL